MYLFIRELFNVRNMIFGIISMLIVRFEVVRKISMKFWGFVKLDFCVMIIIDIMLRIIIKYIKMVYNVINIISFGEFM